MLIVLCMFMFLIGIFVVVKYDVGIRFFFLSVYFKLLLSCLNIIEKYCVILKFVCF